jgi:hypothetical protein
MLAGSCLIRTGCCLPLVAGKPEANSHPAAGGRQAGGKLAPCRWWPASRRQTRTLPLVAGKPEANSHPADHRPRAGRRSRGARANRGRCRDWYPADPHPVVTQGSAPWSFDISAYLKLVAKTTRWDQLPGNTTYPAAKAVLVTTTDVRRSNSAAMYLALASYTANGNSIVSHPNEPAAVLPAMRRLFLGQADV